MKIKRIIPLFLASSLFLASCGKEEAAVVEETLTAVKVTTVEPTSINKVVTYSGKFEPVEQVTVMAKLSGTVTNSYKKVGDEVKAGETLYTIDSSDINLAVNQAQAQADAASLAVNSAQNAKNNITGSQYEQQILSLETSIKNLEANIATAKDALALSKTSYDNTKKLYDVGAASKVELDQVTLSYNQAKAGVEAQELQLAQAKESLTLTQNKLVSESQKTADIGIAQAQASANSASLAVQSASKNLKDVSPTSPISGVVSAKSVVDDQLITTGSPTYTISNIDEVVATINVTENIINNLAVGQQVDVYIKTLDKQVKGTITEVNPVATQTSTFPVKIKLSNKDHVIKPGMFCEVEIVSQNSNNTISLPREAVLRNIEQSYVYVVENGVAVIKNVETGIDNGSEIEIISGLTSGDQVIIEGQTYVSDQEKVNIVE